jgi:flagellar hook-length control protein FliK
LESESTQVAEKANYWIANGTQNIALTLGGAGEEMVALKISISGQDTQIDVRTDHLALRQMIEGSVQDMKEKLSMQGLMLSDLSVGGVSQDQGVGQRAGQGMGKESQRREAFNAPTSSDSSQKTSLQIETSSQKSRPMSAVKQKLSVFV